MILPASALDLPRAPTFEEAYRDHVGDVYRFCLSQLHDPAAAEDAAADVFAAALAAWSRTRPDQRVKVWLMRIARNVVTDRFRERNRAARLMDRLRGRRQPPAADPAQLALLRHDVQLVLDRIAGLGRRDRLIVGLRLAGDMSHAEVAAILGISEGAARVAAHRAAKSLRAALEAQQ